MLPASGVVFVDTALEAVELFGFEEFFGGEDGAADGSVEGVKLVELALVALVLLWRDEGQLSGSVLCGVNAVEEEPLYALVSPILFLHAMLLSADP